MKKISFYEKRDLQNRLKMSKYTERLPDYCLDFFIGIENNTSSLTRYNYSMDLFIFYNYLSQFVFHKKEIEITLNDLNTLKARNIEQYSNFKLKIEQNFSNSLINPNAIMHNNYLNKDFYIIGQNYDIKQNNNQLTLISK